MGMLHQLEYEENLRDTFEVLIKVMKTDICHN